MGFLTIWGLDTRRFPSTRLWGIANSRGGTLQRKRPDFDAHNELPQAKAQQAGETQRQPATAGKFQDPGEGQPGAEAEQEQTRTPKMPVAQSEEAVQQALGEGQPEEVP